MGQCYWLTEKAVNFCAQLATKVAPMGPSAQRPTAGTPSLVRSQLEPYIPSAAPLSGNEPLELLILQRDFQ